MHHRSFGLPTVLVSACIWLAVIGSGCLAAIPHAGRPAAGYEAGAGASLVVEVVDETGGTDWSPSIAEAVGRYAEQAPMLEFSDGLEANIKIFIRRYVDNSPPALRGYLFQTRVGGFAAVYDAEGRACNFPPSPLPVNCSGEIARAEIYLNDAIPPGPDIDERRLRLVMHELGHALGLTRHSPDPGADQLAARYGW